jgi:plasmid stability protein
MKTTLNLPAALWDEVTQRASREGRAVEDVVTDLLTAGLSSTEANGAESGPVVAKTLPLIKVRPAQPAERRRLTTQEWCDWIKDVDVQLEVERYEKALGHQHVGRADRGNSPAS